MGRLTDDMTRLRGEITALKESRRALQRELFQAVGALKREVAADQAAFRQAHAEMARTSRNNRVMFVTDLSHQVSGLLHAVADDLGGARRAWSG
jgi:predicted  nucleic acid-binding Zn-ribbon protein